MSYDGPWRLQTPPTIGPHGHPIVTAEISHELKVRAKPHTRKVMALNSIEMPTKFFKAASQMTLGAAVRVKGRIGRLQRMMGGILKQKGMPFGFVVIDYKCPHGTGKWVRENIDDPRVLLVEVDPGHDYFCYSHAWNVGIRHIDADICLGIDVDLEPVSTNFFTDSVARMLYTDCYWATTGSNAQKASGGAGTTFFYKWLWKDLNGFEEISNIKVQGGPADARWGGEDGNMWGRAGRANSYFPDKSCKFRGAKHLRVFGRGGKTFERRGARPNKHRRHVRENYHIWEANWGHEPGVRCDYRLWTPGMELDGSAEPFWDRVREA